LLKNSTAGRRGIVLARPYSSSASVQGILGAKNIWLPLGSVLLASALGAAAWSRRTVHAQEQEQEDSKPASEKQEEEKKDEEDLQISDKEDFVHYLLERPILLLLLDREDVDEKMDENLEKILADEDLKSMHLLDYQFFSEDKNKFPPNATALVYHFNKENKQIEAYVYPADKELTAENIKQFLADIENHKLEELRYHPSEDRPADDKHPEAKHLKVVTTDSFKDVVLDSDKDVLVYVHLPSNSTPADLQVLANAFAGEDIVIAQCKSFLNELDPKYFGDTPIEGVKLFRRGRKEEPVTYHGKGDLLDIVAFVSRQRGDSGEDIYRHLRRADTTRLLREFEKTLGDYYLHSLAYKEFVPTSDKAKEVFNKLFDMYDQLNNSEDPFKHNAGTLKKQLRDELKALERVGLRNVKIVDKDKYKEELEEARKKGKVVVFFWRKGCWPCKKLNPMVGKISEDFPEVTFLKVDADVEGLNATPAFFVFEDEKPTQLSGMKLVTLFHSLARNRGLPGYANWLPPAERSKLEPADQAGAGGAEQPAKEEAQDVTEKVEEAKEKEELQ
jgi:thiol-disulfide isomerase/thioredoxin